MSRRHTFSRSPMGGRSRALERRRPRFSQFASCRAWSVCRSMPTACHFRLFREIQYFRSPRQSTGRVVKYCSSHGAFRLAGKLTRSVMQHRHTECRSTLWVVPDRAGCFRDVAAEVEQVDEARTPGRGVPHPVRPRLSRMRCFSGSDDAAFPDLIRGVPKAST